MPQSIADVHLHIVFSAFNRRNFLATDEARLKMHAYIGGILNNKDCPPIVIGGVSDHVHLLVEFGRSISISDLVRDVKHSSSMWIKTQGVQDFSWQSGFGAFAVGRPQIEAMKLYIANQDEHHRIKSFQDEFRELLLEHDQTWDERYVWD